MSDQLLRLKDVLAIVPYSKPTLYRRIKDGKFPGPAKDGRCSFWSEAAVMEAARQILQSQPPATCQGSLPIE